MDILEALSQSGAGSGSALAKGLGIPRASFFRLTRQLERHGLVQCGRGTVEPGTLALNLLEGHKARSEAEESRRRMVLGEIAPALPGALPAEPPPLARPARIVARRRFRIGFANGDLTNAWQVALVHSVEFAASRQFESLESVTVMNAGGDADLQNEQIRQMIADGADGILVSAVSPRKLAPLSADLLSHGVPVVLVERGGFADMAYTSFVTSNNFAIGQTTAQWLANRINHRGIVLMLWGHADAEASQSRDRAAREVFARYPDISVVTAEPTSFQRDNAYAATLASINRYGSDIAGVWCDSGLNSAGSIAAFIDAKFDAGKVPPHTGVDINLSYKLAVERRVSLASVDYPPAMGMRAFSVLLEALRGNPVPQYLDVWGKLVTTRGVARPPGIAAISAEQRVRWDMPDDLVFGTGLGPSYSPEAFRVNYPGNVRNRSAATLGAVR
ncbi:hypothetical protein JP75_07440 [Devosia riboflavina]|uniref:HTH iclR-type domain-containing protein n=2 Tax=Devosia riboflavina TaxID=46914 RepID=A0A087M3D8_9HYPH|nr:hypothetical protein JP75_07440 [Devosia riboflavina]